MGDSGSLMLGFTIGSLALLASPGGAGGAAAAVAAPLLILALPALDTALVMLVRFSEGRPLSQGGRDHSSHRLVYNGLGERRAVAVLLALTVNCTATAIALVIFQDALLTALVAGATATGTHGSGDANGILSTAIVALEVVRADGSLRTVDRGDPALSAMAVGLGMFGVITRVVLEIQPTYRVRQDVYVGAPWAGVGVAFGPFLQSEVL